MINNMNEIMGKAGELIYDKLSAMSRHEGINYLRETMVKSIKMTKGVAISNEGKRIATEDDIDEIVDRLYDAIMESKGKCIIPVCKDNLEDLMNDSDLPESIREALKDSSEDIRGTIEDLEKMTSSVDDYHYTGYNMAKYMLTLFDIYGYVDLNTLISCTIGIAQAYNCLKDSLWKAEEKIKETKLKKLLFESYGEMEDKEKKFLGYALIGAGLDYLKDVEDSLVITDEKDSDGVNLSDALNKMMIESILNIGPKRFANFLEKETNFLKEFFDLLESKEKELKNKKDTDENLSDDDLKDILKK